MKTLFKLALSLALVCSFAHAQKLDLATQTKGVLPGANGGRGDTSNGVNGQVLIGDGAGHFAPGDPIVSFNYANLLTTQPATGSAVGAAVRLSTFGASGTLYVTFASITGSGTSCTVQLKNYDSLGNAINNGSPISVTPANGTTTSGVVPALALQTAAQMSATYSCSSYPSGGTITVDFVPGVSIGIAGTVKVDGSAVTQPISAVSLPLPAGAATSANQPALVGGRTPVDPSGVTSPVSAASLPLPSGASTSAKQPALGTAGTPSVDVITVQGAASMTAVKTDGSAVTQPVSGTLTANVGTTNGLALDATLTGGTTKAISRGGQKGTTNTNADITHTASGANHEGLDVALYDASGNQLGLSATPVRTDPTGTTTQPVNGTVAANQGTANTAANGWPVKVTDGTNSQSVNASGGAEMTGDSPSAVADAGNPVKTGGVFNTAQPTVTNGQRVDNQSTARGAQIVAPGVDNTAANAWFAKLTDGTNTQAVKAASTAAAATDPSSVTQLSPNQPQLTTPLNVQGGKTNNNAAPGATNMGTLPALANAAPPSWTEGNQTAVSIDLKGNLRVYGHPPDVLGCYMVNGRTGTYAGQAAGAPLISFRWGDATHFAVIMRVATGVATTTAATVAGQAERELIIARSFTVSDTGGTAVTLTGNNQKMRTSQATSLVTDLRAGQPLTAGTRTLDANPIASVVSFLPLNMTGMDIGCGAGGPFVSGQAWTCTGGLGLMPLLNATTGQDYPLVLAQNEGFIIRIGKDAQPTTAVQQTYYQISWCEVNAY